MREATGNAILMTMMTSIIAIIMIFFVGSISYSKSYRIKNYIINQIEENDGWNDTIDTQLSSYLKDVGYSKEKFQRYMTEQIKRTKEVYKKDMLFLFAWNEWGEGGYLEPDECDKYGRLEAVREAIKHNS